MENKALKRRLLRRKYKRHAAALAGAALLTGAVLSGIPAGKVLAAESPAKTAPRTEHHGSMQDRPAPPGHGWHPHKHSWPASDENQAWYQDGTIYYHHTGTPTSYAHYFSNPLDFLKENAADYDIDADRDTFTLLSVSRLAATIEVTRQSDQAVFDFRLERTPRHPWTIVQIERR